MKFRTFLPVIAALLMATAVSAQEKPKKSSGESNPKGEMVKFTPPKVIEDKVEVKEVKKTVKPDTKPAVKDGPKVKVDVKPVPAPPPPPPSEKRSGN